MLSALDSGVFDRCLQDSLYTEHNTVLLHDLFLREAITALHKNIS